MDWFKGESLRNGLVEEKIPVKWIGLRENLQGKSAGFYSQVHDLFFGAYCTFVPEAGDWMPPRNKGCININIPEVGYSTIRCHQWKSQECSGRITFFCSNQDTTNMAINDHYDVVPPSWEFVGWYSPFASLIYVMYHKPKVLEWETNLAFTLCDTTFVFDSIMACWNIPHRWYSQRTEAPFSEVSQLTVHVWYHILI